MQEYEIEVTAYLTKNVVVQSYSLDEACLLAQEEMESIIENYQAPWNFEFNGPENENDLYENKFFRNEETDIYKVYDDFTEDENDFQQ